MNAYQEKLTKVLEALVVHTANEYGGSEGFGEDGARDGLNEARAAINALNAEHWLPKPIVVTPEQDEEWQPVVGYEGIYEVSNRGRIKSSRGLLKPTRSISKSDYPRVTLRKPGEGKHHTVHRLVAKAFIPNPLGKPCVNHKDLDKGNNHLSNLEWCSYSENARHAVANGIILGDPEVSRVNLEKARAQSMTYITHEGVTKSAREWAEGAGISYPTFYYRFKIRGWSMEDILRIPVKHRVDLRNRFGIEKETK